MHAFETHDHAGCISDGIAMAERHCAENGLRLTPARRRVFEILLGEHKAMGAYDILDRLRADGHGAQPPVAYRALDFLVEQGFVHRVEKLKAFIACAHPDETHTPAFLICRTCERVDEATTAPDAGEIGRAAVAAGFFVERTVREAEGLCPDCAFATDTGAPA